MTMNEQQPGAMVDPELMIRTTESRQRYMLEHLDEVRQFLDDQYDGDPENEPFGQYSAKLVAVMRMLKGEV